MTTNEVKAIILCNNPIALPAVKEFLFYNKVAAIVIPRKNAEITDLLTGLIEGTGAKLITVDRKTAVPLITTAIQEHAVTVGLVMTFPYILPTELISLPAKGFINFHYGLLPQCRGPHPIFWHILNKDPEAGVTVHRMDEGIDTGPIVQQLKIPVSLSDTYGMLQSKLAYEGAKAAANLLKILSYGSILPSVPQDETKAAYYAKPQAADITVRFETMDTEAIIRMVNACNPWNKAAAAMVNNWMIGITGAELTDKKAPDGTAPGTILELDAENGMLVHTTDHKVLCITIVYLQEGFFPGWKLAQFGIKVGHLLL